MTRKTAINTMELMDSTRPGSSIGLGDAWHGPSVAEARQFVRGLLEHWHFDPVTTADTILVTSELVTNAFVHAAGPVRLDVDRHDEAVVISVQDADPSPVPRDAAPGDESGRGLHIVRHLARSFGWSRHAHHKVVWAVLAPPTRELGATET